MLSQVTVEVLKYARQTRVMGMAMPVVGVAAGVAEVANMVGKRELDFGLSLIIPVHPFPW